MSASKEATDLVAAAWLSGPSKKTKNPDGRLSNERNGKGSTYVYSHKPIACGLLRELHVDASEQNISAVLRAFAKAKRRAK